MEKKSHKIHVVYIITKLELGGAQKVCLELLSGLRHMRVGTSLISGADGVLADRVKKIESVHLLPTMKRELRLTSLWTEVKNFITMVRLLRELKKKHSKIVVHTHSTKAGLLGRWAAFFARIPHRVHTVHGYGFHDYQSWLVWLPIYILELITSLITTQFICVSEKDRQTGMRLFPRFGRKSLLIRAAVAIEVLYDTAVQLSHKDDRFVPAVRAQELFVFGTISCFKPQKNLFDLLEAFKVVHQTMISNGMPAPQLEIIGDGEQRNALEGWIAKEGLTEAITLLGWQADVVRWMRRWNIFVLSSLWEGLPCAVVEARLCHIPVVAYDVGGIGEVIVNGKNGFLVKPKEWINLSERILAIVRNPVLYHTLCTSHDRLDDFSTHIMVKKHHNLYVDLVDKAT